MTVLPLAAIRDIRAIVAGNAMQPDAASRVAYLRGFDAAAREAAAKF